MIGLPTLSVFGKRAVARASDSPDDDDARGHFEDLVHWRSAARNNLRIAAGSLVLAAVCVAFSVSLGAKLRGPFQTVVFDRTGKTLSYGGVASEETVADDDVAQAGVEEWIRAARCIGGISGCGRQRKRVLAMTDIGSPANPKQKLDALFTKIDRTQAEDPTEMRLIVGDVTVTPLPVEIGAAFRTYLIAWSEQTVSAKGNSIASHSGQVTISNQHPLSGDPEIAKLNPFGVYVEQFETNAGDMR